MTAVPAAPAAALPSPPPLERQYGMTEAQRILVKRLVSCLFGGFVLALMVGNQEGSQNDFGISFAKATTSPRLEIFLVIGLAIFGLITFWAVVKPYAKRPGVVPIGVGFLVVVAAQTIMNWYDPLPNSATSKFNELRKIVDKTSSLSSTTQWFFDWLAWTLLVGGLVVCGFAIVTRLKPLGYLTAAIGVAGAVLAYDAHRDVVNAGRSLGHPDHALGMYTAVIGYLIMAGAGITAVHSRVEVADWREFLKRAMVWRPGLPFSVIATIFGLLAYTTAGWYAPLTKNDKLADAHRDFAHTALSSLGSQYLGWLGWTLFAVATLLALAAALLVNRLLGWAAIVASVAGIVITFFTLRSMTYVAAKAAPEQGGSWENLGVGGFLACIVFAVLAAAAVQVLSATRRSEPAQATSNDLPVTKMIRQTRGSSLGMSLLVVVVALALFYPPMLPVVWQSAIVSQIGIYVLLAVGLNVVVGWAGLLDLGYIAFYEVGAYTTAYFCGSLPVKPPSWLILSPLETIPFSILACLIAGVVLGAPTLRLRGDYLAIVTLGFGEIVQILSINMQGVTGGPQGPNIPHPHIHIGALSITFGQDNLPYWYLLLIMLTIVIVLFYRLEGSRLGRAWAAIREDEVAAQATGVNTHRVKLLAFAIGASTSALAGTFFASQVGYFDPTLFTLQASILIVAYVVFGGMGSLQGAMAGAAVLTWLPQFLKSQVPPDDRQMWVGALVLAMMIFRPAGLLPAKRRRAELEGLEGAESSEVTAVPAAGAL